MRLTTSKSHDQFIKAIASQMGTESNAEVINYLLWELRKSNYSFGAQLPQQSPQQSPPQAPQIEFDRPRQAFVPQSPQAIREYEELAEAIDPVISRFLALGLADQF